VVIWKDKPNLITRKLKKQAELYKLTMRNTVSKCFVQDIFGQVDQKYNKNGKYDV